MKQALAPAVAVLLITATSAQSQTIDMAEIKCSDLTKAYPEQFAVIDAWLSGYYHAMSNKTVVDRKMGAENTRKVVQYCKANPNVTVMRAIENLRAQ